MATPGKALPILFLLSIEYLWDELMPLPPGLSAISSLPVFSRAKPANWRQIPKAGMGMRGTTGTLDQEKLSLNPASITTHFDLGLTSRVCDLGLCCTTRESIRPTSQGHSKETQESTHEACSPVPGLWDQQSWRQSRGRGMHKAWEIVCAPEGVPVCTSSRKVWKHEGRVQVNCPALIYQACYCWRSQTEPFIKSHFGSSQTIIEPLPNALGKT